MSRVYWKINVKPAFVSHFFLLDLHNIRYKLHRRLELLSVSSWEKVRSSCCRSWYVNSLVFLAVLSLLEERSWSWKRWRWSTLNSGAECGVVFWCFWSSSYRWRTWKQCWGISFSWRHSDWRWKSSWSKNECCCCCCFSIRIVKKLESEGSRFLENEQKAILERQTIYMFMCTRRTSFCFIVKVNQFFNCLNDFRVFFLSSDFVLFHNLLKNRYDIIIFTDVFPAEVIVFVVPSSTYNILLQAKFFRANKSAKIYHTNRVYAFESSHWSIETIFGYPSFG